MDKLERLIDLYERTLEEAEANQEELFDYIERTRIEDRKYFDETRDRLAEIHDNLQYLCLECHNKKTFKTLESIGDGLMFDSNGELISIE